MTESKIPRIEYVLVIPVSIEENLKSLLNFYKNNLTKSLRILKKSKYRITTTDFIKNIKFKSILEDFISQNHIDLFDSNLIDKDEVINDFKKLLDKKDNIIGNSINKFLVEYIEKIIDKYLKIIIHLDDQVFVCTNKNKENNKIFVKFFLPKVVLKNSDENGNAIDSIDEINKNKDNVHATILPTTGGHGLDGIFHLTFRIEGKNKTWFEYSKYLSLNRESNKFGFIVYNDDKCSDYIMFKITNDFEKLLNLLKYNKINNILEDFFNSKVYNDLCDFIVYDIFNKLISNKKIDMFLNRYFNIVGIKIINSIINKLLKIIFLTFVDMSYF
jgi:hypothetical protein